MINVAINGVCGRMGLRIATLVAEDKDLQLVAALERKGHQCIGKNLSTIISRGHNDITISEELSGSPEVLIDFTSPDSTMNRLKACVDRGVAIVTGTTGLDKKQMGQLKDASQTIPCLFSPNMSVGVNLLFNLAEYVSKILGNETDIEIIESHHRYKKDAPSGTALRLAENICSATDRKMDEVVIYGRKGITDERPQDQICIHSIRSGDIVGEHTVTFCNAGERLELVHKAQTRDSFALGSLRAAKFLAGKPPGYYNMKDALGS
ncbi:dihydrodipicolinate reductase [Candidatus Scalindua japonica]|uniref:4-hydroxy-tetrahydrodipicolinate reductase n=1 Tax=Candidatus Scalindua japonica TaxID=1284222 RepID=A0A286TWJ9_9BACT|nr:4-hydroxy-tetrahydrodipicolinate reductase [Candidatus Scalindua japonica]GAX60211.1 dihydrodipicolinate reductase [Candidatus Scalindua japonica]